MTVALFIYRSKLLESEIPVLVVVLRAWVGGCGGVCRCVGGGVFEALTSSVERGLGGHNLPEIAGTVDGKKQPKLGPKIKHLKAIITMITCRDSKMSARNKDQDCFCHNITFKARDHMDGGTPHAWKQAELTSNLRAIF